MKEFANSLKILFFIGNDVLVKRNGYEHSKLEDDSSLYLDFNNPKDRAILELLMKSDILHVDGIVYKVITREFMLDGTALFIVIEPVNK
jgi:hypothetical protein